MNEKFKSLFKDTFIFALGGLGSKVILFFLVFLYTNFLSTEEYGIADLIFTTAQLIIPIVSIVIYQAIVRFGLMVNQKPGEVLKVGILVGNVGAVFTVLITPIFNFYPPIAQWRWYLCACVILDSNADILKSYLKAKELNKKYAIISVIQTLVMALMNVLFLAVFKIGVRGYLLSNIIASGMTLLIALFAGGAIKDLHSTKFNKLLCWEMIKYSAPLILNDLSWWVIHSSDKFMLEVMVSASALGIFTVATKIPSLINVLISIFAQAWNISSIKEMDSSNDTNFYEKVFAGYSFITFFACILIDTVVKPFMGVYVGKNFSGAWMYVPLLLVSAVFSSISSYFGQLYSALKKSVNNMLTTLFAAVVNIIVNYICIKMFGIMGAVIGTMVSYAVISTARMIDVRRYVDVRINLNRYLINCIIVFVQAVLVTLDWHISAVSVGSIVIFAFVNRKILVEFYHTVRSRLGESRVLKGRRNK